MEDEEESIAESEQSVIKTADAYQNHILELIEGGLIYELILLHSDNVLKVKSFL